MSDPSAQSIDPVKWIALLVSMVALVSTYLNNNSQDKKWEALNAPRFVLVPPPHFAAFEELNASVAKSKKWGYQPLLVFYMSSDGVDTGKIRRYTDLTWSKRASYQDHGSPAATLKEAESSGRLLDKKDFVLMKHLQAHFEFRNSGSLPAKNVVVQTEARWVEYAENNANGEWLRASETGPAEIDAGGPVGLNIDLFRPLEVPFPKKAQFRFRFNWEGQKEPWIKIVHYDFAQNAWGL